MDTVHPCRFAANHLHLKAGIPIFVTGGIGGVHRGDAWDVGVTQREKANVLLVLSGPQGIRVGGPTVIQIT